jgi:hypothetical protein
LATALLASLFAPFIVACGGGGNGAGGTGATTIEGRVSGVAAASTLADPAQPGGGSGGASVSGIAVEARRSGQTLDAATTDAQGRFTLEFVGGGPIGLIFSTEEATLSLTLDVLPGSIVTLVVELYPARPEVIIIERFDDDDGFDDDDD